MKDDTNMPEYIWSGAKFQFGPSDIEWSPPAITFAWRGRILFSVPQHGFRGRLAAVVSPIVRWLNGVVVS